MSQDNVEIVGRIFEAWASGDWSIGRDYLDPHAVCVVSSDFPAFGAYYGVDGIRTYWRDFLAQWERLTLEATGMQAVGDTVIAEATQHSKGRASGIEGAISYFMLFTFRGGRVVRMEAVMSRAEALQAVGLPDQGAPTGS
jgi:ketosteroid isomerase-like protein